ncbi:hypothetical protein DOTSEDRAFT_51901 [Dothistroma septosporum NZE10]|uniref:Yeast cell wall synthesis Kre9/Knh1-like N-terminal domain-containing protein n=1 Tax=Dothistroma septosporum (strain NZE10 / CBS 128990) TaxID=675120 RepID=N1PSI4_DOTSN|nr:hypothetical protein DOTSEDRAFT_51901 [Dothistroma septosporum NZE10]
MSDFSYFSLFTAGLACLVPLTAAYTKPVGAQPEGNPISRPGLNTVVPAGENFTITWDPTTKGTVTLLLLKGPSTNAVPQYPIVEMTPNDGTYVWQVKDDLEPSPEGVAQGYGIQLIDDATGQYQYTTQFGVSNPDYKKGSESSSESATPTKSAEGYGKTSSASPTYHKDYTTYCPSPTVLSVGNKTYTVTTATTLTITDCSCTVHPTSSAYVAHPSLSTGNAYPSHNVTMVAPTGYTPKTLSTASTYNMPSATASSTTPAQQTGAASTVAGGVFGALLAAGVAVLAM